jgi:thymidylate synthase
MFENDKKELVLNMNTHWRSRDGYKAAFMNIFALTELQKIVADKISAKLNRKVAVGRYTDMADSFHIYGSYHTEFKRFIETVEQRSFEERTWNSEFAIDSFEDAKKQLEQEKTQK